MFMTPCPACARPFSVFRLKGKATSVACPWCDTEVGPGGPQWHLLAMAGSGFASLVLAEPFLRISAMALFPLALVWAAFSWVWWLKRPWTVIRDEGLR